MSYVHREERLVYLAHPRTASVATAEALKRVGFKQLQDHHALVIPDGPYTVFTTVREHKDALASLYAMRRVFWDRHGQDPNDPSWVIHEIDEGSLSHVVGPHRLFPFTERATRVLRFEQLDQDIDLIIPGLEIPRTNITKGPKPVFDPQMQAWIETYFHQERRELGYD